MYLEDRIELIEKKISGIEFLLDGIFKEKNKEQEQLIKGEIIEKTK